MRDVEIQSHVKRFWIGVVFVVMALDVALIFAIIFTVS